jgi:hypothetical protein
MAPLLTEQLRTEWDCGAHVGNDAVRVVDGSWSVDESGGGSLAYEDVAVWSTDIVDAVPLDCAAPGGARVPLRAALSSSDKCRLFLRHATADDDTTSGTVIGGGCIMDMGPAASAVRQLSPRSRF